MTKGKVGQTIVFCGLSPLAHAMPDPSEVDRPTKSDRLSHLAAEFAPQPGLGQAQVVADDVDGLAQGLGRFFGGHASEVPHFNQPCQGLVFPGEHLEGGVQVEELDWFHGGGPIHLGAGRQHNSRIGIALFSGAGSGVVHQNLPHDARRHGEKVHPVGESALAIAQQFQVCLMNQARGLAAIELRERLSLFLRVCDGVSHAHGHLIIHRDLKPANILVDASGQPKLLTPNYASPEQRGGGMQTTATDVYSLGAVRYKLLRGRSPQESETADAGRLKRSLPTDIDYVVGKALRQEPEDRVPEYAIG